MTYWLIVCAINSVSNVACIRAGRVYIGRSLKASSSALEICVTSSERIAVVTDDDEGDC